MGKHRALNYRRAYTAMHEDHPKHFAGRLALECADAIAELVDQLDQNRPPRLLDYGSGKGYQYLRDRVHERWGGALPHCYDVGVIHFQDPPVGPFDGVICTDVLEHIARADMIEVLEHVFGLIRPGGFAYFNVFCNIAAKSFPSGQNVHLTVEPPDWWRALLLDQAPPGVKVWSSYEYIADRHDM